MTDNRSDWQKRQAALCSCKGTDDYCPCQNVDFAAPKPTQPSIGMDERERLIGRLKGLLPHVGQTFQREILEDAIVALSATVGEVVEVLAPFANFAKVFDDDDDCSDAPDHLHISRTSDHDEPTIGDCRRARALHERLAGKDRAPSTDGH